MVGRVLCANTLEALAGESGVAKCKIWERSFLEGPARREEPKSAGPMFLRAARAKPLSLGSAVLFGYVLKTVPGAVYSESA
jgi:hypothetical protein